MFSQEISKISKNTFFYRTPLVAAFVCIYANPITIMAISKILVSKYWFDNHQAEVFYFKEN